MRKDPKQNTNQLGNLLDRYKKQIKAPQASVEKEAITVIKNITGFALKKRQLKYTPATRTLAIIAPSVIKSELKFKNKDILLNLEKSLGKANCPTVIL